MQACGKIYKVAEDAVCEDTCKRAYAPEVYNVNVARLSITAGG